MSAPKTILLVSVLGVTCLVVGCAAARDSARPEMRSGVGRIESAGHHAPTPEQALEYAKSVVLVRREVQGDLVYSYVKEVWRFEFSGELPPSIGSPYGMPLPYDSRIHFQKRDAIVFDFGRERSKEFPVRWTVQINDKGQAYPFQKVSFEHVGLKGATDVDTSVVQVNEGMSVDEVRQLVKKTTRKREEPNQPPEPTAMSVTPPAAQESRQP